MERLTNRVDLHFGEAICIHEGFGEHYLMDNFSTTGAKLRGGPPPPVGAMVKTVIFVGTVGMAVLPGEVVRHGDRGSFGVAFADVSASDELLLEELMMRAGPEGGAHYLEDCPP